MTTNTTTSLLSTVERALLRANWRALLSTDRTQPAEAYLCLALLLGRDPKKAFSPITNPVKLANGQTPWQGLALARTYGLWYCRHQLQALFAGLPAERTQEITEVLLAEIKQFRIEG